MKPTLIVLVSMLLATKLYWSQTFLLMRCDEDYSVIKDSTMRLHDKLKYIPLSPHGTTYLSLGGEVRVELDYALNEDWGEQYIGRDVFFLQRYHVHADLHLGNRLRFFGQLRSGLEDGRKTGPRGIDEDQLNVQNLFVDVVPYRKSDRALTLRMGRQEIRYGSGRLVDVRDGPNLRLYFDGVRVAYASSSFNVDAFAMVDAKVNTGVFDNTSTRKVSLWGIYSTFKSTKRGSLDVYYLGIRRVDATFDEGIATESRHTVGARFWQNERGFIYNFETVYQFGTFGVGTISAMAVSSEIGYRFDSRKGMPAVKLRSDYISGDKIKGDGRLGTFNAMYPNGGYFGVNPQAGPANLLAIHPNFSWSPGKNVLLTLDVVLNWRHSIDDGVYGPNGALRLPAFNSEKRYIGTAYMSTFTWHINGFLNYNVGVQYFKTGSFINDVIPHDKDGFFVGSVLGFKF